VIGSFIARPFLVMTDCPAECIDHATIYATFYFLGMPLLLLYHYAAAIIRVGGDSQRPLYYMLIAGVCNLALNTFFCAILSQKVVAVALATALSKGLAAFLALRHLVRGSGRCRWEIKQTRFDFASFKTMILYGLPTAITSCLYPIANMQIAAGINSYGADFVAGSTASQQYEKMLGSYNVGLAATALTMMGQNLGAKKPKRVYRVFFDILILELCLVLGTATIVYSFGESLIPIFAGNNAAAIEAGMLRMRIMLFSYCILHTPLGPAIQAFGYPTLQTAINTAGILGVRTLWMQIVYGRLVPQTAEMVFMSFPVSYIFTTACYAVCVLVILLRYRKGKYKKKI
jgi:Na+-driven multidrug efflux pump